MSARIDAELAALEQLDHHREERRRLLEEMESLEEDAGNNSLRKPGKDHERVEHPVVPTP